VFGLMPHLRQRKRGHRGVLCTSLAAAAATQVAAIYSIARIGPTSSAWWLITAALAASGVGVTYLLMRRNSGVRARRTEAAGADSAPALPGVSEEEKGGQTEARPAVTAETSGLVKAFGRGHFETILDSLTSAVIAVEENGKMVFANRATARLLDTPRESLLGADIKVLPNGLCDLVSKCMDAGCEVSDHQLPPHAEGVTPLTVSISLLRNSNGNVEGGVMILNDASAMEELRKRVRDQERLAWLGTLAAVVAHELKNPLVSIRTLAQLLPEKFDDAEFRNEFSTLALSEVDRINSMVERLLDFARPSQPSVEIVDINRLIEDTLALLKPQIAENNVKVEALYSATDATLLGDATQLKQVFLNLALNSIQAVRDHGMLTVRTSNPVDSSELLVQIIDDGVGIPEDKIDKVFDPFFSTKQRGTGLGLTISQMVVLQHNGTVEVSSEEGEGTSFSVRLPLTSHNPDRIGE